MRLAPFIPCAQAAVHGTGLAEGVGGISVLNEFYGRGDIPIGAYRGHVGNPEHTPAPGWVHQGRGVYLQDMLDHFNSTIRSWDDVPDSLSVYRSSLASAADASVTVVNIGHTTNLLDLLESGPDIHSDLTGLALVQKKVLRP